MMRGNALVLAAVLAAAILLPALGLAEEVVHFYNRSEYLPEKVLEQFTKETGIRVVYTTYESNEALYAKLKSPKAGSYDLIVPSTQFVSKMAKEGMLRKLDLLKIPNLGNLDPRLMNKSYDPRNQYSIPYLWGATGLAVNSEKVDPAKVTGWADLWKPEFEGKLLLLDDLREVFHMALRILGYPGNSTDPKQIKEAYEKLTALMPNVRVFNSDSPKVSYLAGKAAAGMIRNGEAFAAQEENSKIRFIYPKEGAILWVDSMVIPANARNVDNAHQLINFLLRPAIAKAISEEVGYATPNVKALDALDPEVRKNHILYPADEDLKKADCRVDIGDAVNLYEKYWEKLKAGR